MKKIEFIVSACLAGKKCRFDGDSRPCARVMELCRQGLALPVCPESLSGLPVPRPPCEAKNGKIISKDGKDVTLEFEKGAERALKIALGSGAKKVILKARSPSCGFGQIYDGSFSKTLTKGNGVFADKLHKKGFEVFTEDDLSKIK